MGCPVTAAQLHAALTQALAEGLDPASVVVIETEGWFHVVEAFHSPTSGNHGYDLWPTLTVGSAADSRSTPGHEHTFDT